MRKRLRFLKNFGPGTCGLACRCGEPGGNTDAQRPNRKEMRLPGCFFEGGLCFPERGRCKSGISGRRSTKRRILRNSRRREYLFRGRAKRFTLAKQFALQTEARTVCGNGFGMLCGEARVSCGASSGGRSAERRILRNSRWRECLFRGQAKRRLALAKQFALQTEAHCLRDRIWYARWDALW